ncbi:pentapeptide repeat-containing protein [Synechococcus sp. MU1611]|nr:pentapeptide repeat-containing protein [Synechococcus sp. MU1611]
MFKRPLVLSLMLPFCGSLCLAADPDALSQALLERRCEACDLRSADLVHADLSTARLRNAQLQLANLSQANLEGADLFAADLRQAILAGASLRGADLRSARLEGVDLRSSDLTGALLDDAALIRSHWRGAIGLQPDWLSAAHFHNAGVAEAEAGRWPAAEQLFTAALALVEDEPLSWAGRGVSRGFQGKVALAASDLAKAEALSRASGDFESAERLKQLQLQVLESVEPELTQGGNGLGGAALEGVAGTLKPFSSVLQSLAPIALKFLMPLPF